MMKIEGFGARPVKWHFQGGSRPLFIGPALGWSLRQSRFWDKAVVLWSH